MALLSEIRKEPESVAIVVYANAVNSGGGYEFGSLAQEEDIMRSFPSVSRAF